MRRFSQIFRKHLSGTTGVPLRGFWPVVYPGAHARVAPLSNCGDLQGQTTLTAIEAYLKATLRADLSEALGAPRGGSHDGTCFRSTGTLDKPIGNDMDGASLHRENGFSNVLILD